MRDLDVEFCHGATLEGGCFVDCKEVAAFGAGLVFLLFIFGFDFGVICIDDVYNPKVSNRFFEGNLKDVPCEKSSLCRRDNELRLCS